jgi:hypothetical protein
MKDLEWGKCASIDRTVSGVIRSLSVMLAFINGPHFNRFYVLWDRPVLFRANKLELHVKFSIVNGKLLRSFLIHLIPNSIEINFCILTYDLGLRSYKKRGFFHDRCILLPLFAIYLRAFTFSCPKSCSISYSYLIWGLCDFSYLFIISFVRLLELRPLLAYCASLGW